MTSYIRRWHISAMFRDLGSLDEIVAVLRSAIDFITDMDRDGVSLDEDVGDDYATFITEDAKIAARYGFVAEEDDI